MRTIALAIHGRLRGAHRPPAIDMTLEVPGGRTPAMDMTLDVPGGRAPMLGVAPRVQPGPGLAAGSRALPQQVVQLPALLVAAVRAGCAGKADVGAVAQQRGDRRRGGGGRLAHRVADPRHAAGHVATGQLPLDPESVV